MSQIGRLWRGELTLDNAFWNWAVIGGILINAASSVLFFILVTRDQLFAALIVGYGLSLPYNILVLVGVWRAADRYTGEPRWADLARGVTVVGVILLSIT